MRSIAILPFAALGSLDPVLRQVADFVALDLAGFLSRSGVVNAALIQADERAEAQAQALAQLAVLLETELALGGSVRLDPEAETLQLSALLADARGNERGRWTETLPLGQGPSLGQLIARAVLLALGEDASALPESSAAPVPAAAFLALCKTQAFLESDPGRAADQLLRLATEAPAFAAPQRILISAAQAAANTEAMPAFLAALERLVELRPADPEALIALGEYRALHLDDEGARVLFLEARDLATEPEQGAQALAQLAVLAARGGRPEEAIAHLRSAVRLIDDAALHLRLGELLLERDPQEAVRSFRRATVLAPDNGAAQLFLSRALRKAGEEERAAEAAAVAIDLAQNDPALLRAARAELDDLQ